MKSMINVTDLSVSFTGDDGKVTALDNISFSIPEGKTVCLVGESGCGKSVTAKALLRILDNHAAIESGKIEYTQMSSEILDLAEGPANAKHIRAIQGNEISMIYQEPMTSLSPLYTIGNQIVEVLSWHTNLTKAEAKFQAIEMLRLVGIPSAADRFDSYTFELSGGMRQRAMIAMALICNPRLLVADEPTTALDVTTQAIILDLMRELQQTRNMSMLFITHDLGVVADIADEVVIMYLGNVVEQGPVEQILTNPQHPYTQGLLASLPHTDGKRRARLNAIPGVVPSLHNRPKGCQFQDRCDHFVAGVCNESLPELTAVSDVQSVRCHAFGAKAELVPLLAPVTQEEDALHVPNQIDRSEDPILELQGVSKHFPIRSGFFNRHSGTVRSLNDVSLKIWRGETLGLVGESGCGKSTLGQTIIGLHKATTGKVLFRPENETVELTQKTDSQLRPYWTNIRMVFQDPNSSLNPRMAVYDIIAEVLRVGQELKTKKDIEKRVLDVMEKIGFDKEFLKRYPHAFSGGQRQRIGIARALAPYPKVIIADEAVSALDVSVQAQILNLLKDLQEELGLTYLFISHDLSVVAHISDRVAVMYAGRIVELADTETIFKAAKHPYTEALMSAILEPIPVEGALDTRIRLEGNVPDPSNLPKGCSFAPRCRYATSICESSDPALGEIGTDHMLACHHPDVVQITATENIEMMAG
ncbi:ABC transporter ATP-binding protein [Pseudovibrio sp. Tun.PSC04-5.I4]|uniref:ABC transporter ATP-binding protein n=1 Tax=Pseudovibrio sp. Tun.PSC04-5.I4 TaxID=1798213 RepID=UPI00088ED71B|nr:ABC transporter ATP-binding protein [Pseudovibrio sp. Tun.PSC04-5.I4]SDQ16002.1 peptide/nickel transport system ATP-binding protein [Pseudovibrio sp. Tun.PSC04-5.I4]